MLGLKYECKYGFLFISKMNSELFHMSLKNKYLLPQKIN